MVQNDHNETIERSSTGLAKLTELRQFDTDKSSCYQYLLIFTVLVFP